MKELFSADYFRDLVTLIRDNGDIDAFIKRIEDAERTDFLTNDKLLKITDHNIQSSEAQLDEIQKEIDLLNRKKELVAQLQNITASCPEGRELDLLYFLVDYVTNWHIDSPRYTRLTAPPTGLINRIKNSKRVREWSDMLFEFLNQCDWDGNKDALHDIVSKVRYAHKYGVAVYDDVAYTLNMSYGSQTAHKQYAQNILQQEREIWDRRIAYYDSNDVNHSDYARMRQRRRRKIAELEKYIKNPEPLNVSDYVKRLDKIDDEEPVMFDIGTTVFRTNTDDKVALNNIMWMRGLQTGYDVNAWYIRESNPGPDNDLEIFSPLMSAGDAKKVVPQLLRDMELLDMRIGILLPIMGRDLPKQSTQKNEPIDMSEISRLIQVAKFQTAIAEYRTNGIFDTKKDIIIQRIQEIGFESIEDLMAVPIYKSDKELMAKYPPDKYLFGGTAVSDDYFSFSRRNRRSGLIYASLNPHYAAGYSCARYSGTSPTTDKYISTVIGQTTDGNDIHVGFVNIYAQSPEDEFYRNFGIEYIRGNEYDKKISSRLRALYLGDCETFITRDKNPLVQKMLHIAVHFKIHSYAPVEYYVPISALSEKMRNALLQNRQARLEITYPSEPEMVARLYAQRAEFDSGTVHKMPIDIQRQTVTETPLNICATQCIRNSSDR